MVSAVTGFPLVEIRGGPRERGRQFGAACREQIQRYADGLLSVMAGEAALRSLPPENGAAGGASSDARPRPLTREDLYARALTFLPAFETFAPHLVEEIRGIAEGADLPFGAALLVNVRAEVAGVTGIRAGDTGRGGEGCTSFAVGRTATAGGGMLLGQNQDQSPEMEAFGVVLRVRPDNGPPSIMATFGGLVGYPGMNGAGVAHFQNALSNGVWRHALPHYPMKRALLEQKDVAGCLRVMDRAPLASCGNYVLGDRSGAILDVETTPDGYAVVQPEDDMVVHTNHFQSPRFTSQERLLSSLPDSGARLSRMRRLMGQARSHITLDSMKGFLQDHDGGPSAICRHEPDRPMKTIASIIAEPDHGRLHVSAGNPCETEYMTYSL